MNQGEGQQVLGHQAKHLITFLEGTGVAMSRKPGFTLTTADACPVLRVPQHLGTCYLTCHQVSDTGRPGQISPEQWGGMAATRPVLLGITQQRQAGGPQISLPFYDPVSTSQCHLCPRAVGSAPSLFRAPDISERGRGGDMCRRALQTSVPGRLDAGQREERDFLLETQTRSSR